MGSDRSGALAIHDVTERMCSAATSPLERGWLRMGLPAGGCDLAYSGDGDNRDPTVSIWILTLAIFSYFLVWSFVAALLATHFEWLSPTRAPL
jgi:hypothetical protein